MDEMKCGEAVASDRKARIESYSLPDRVRNGERLIGTWLYLNDVGAAEVLAGAGFDFIMVDMEHSPTGFGDLRNLFMAIENRCAAIVRVKGNAPEFISAALDLGAAGVMVPRVNSAEETAHAVRSAKFAPLGQRGIGPFRVSDYGRDMDRIFSLANEKQMLWVQVEDKRAVANIKDMVQVPGVDLFFIGRGDLSQSLGCLGKANEPEVRQQAENALQVIRDAGLPAGSAFGPGEDVTRWRRNGMTVFTVASDFRCLVDGAAMHLSATRAALGASEPSSAIGSERRKSESGQ